MQPQVKVATAIVAVSATNAQATSGAIDTLGYAHATVIVCTGKPNVVSNKPSTIKISEGDTSSSFTDVTGLVGGTDFTIPNADTVNDNYYVFNLDLKKRKRWLKVSLTPITTVIVDAKVILSKGNEAPITAAKAGALTLVEL